jgi:hypothetical protein
MITRESFVRTNYKKINGFIFATLLALTPFKSAFAEYYVVGPIYAEDCYDLGIKVCSKLTVTEVRRDGKRFEIGTVYKTASYSNGKCSIETKSRGLGPLSWGLNAVMQPEFWGYDKDGKYVKIDADRIFFDCVKK